MNRESEILKSLKKGSTMSHEWICSCFSDGILNSYVSMLNMFLWKTLDLGGKGGKGGGNEGAPKMALHDSIFSCDRR